ncbi:MAG: ComF family protein [Bacteroidia bacterium]|nr:ComF family protein [Bacteroidia bacterium]
MINYLKDFINLFFPNICMACGTNLLTNEKSICTGCLYHLPKTNYHKEKNNPVSQMFWGKTFIENATAYYFFHKGSKFQDLIHNLKYKGQKEIGFVLGSHLGADLKESELYRDITMVVPVPLHPKREKKRGYNQSDFIARGIAESMKIEANTTSLYRAVETETQTKKSKLDRWKNVENIFRIRREDAFIDKHVLLVDDVITTGSTIEACAEALLAVKGTKVSVACLAVAAS